MNKEKKSKKQDEYMISDLINSLHTEVLIRSLEFEESINIKKINNEKLTEAENFFDTYFIKSRKIRRRLERGII